MKHNYFILGIIFLFCFSFCKKQKTNEKEQVENKFDSISFYLKKFEKNNNAIFLEKALLLIKLDKNNTSKSDKISKVMLGYVSLGDLQNVKKTAFLLKNVSIKLGDSLQLANSYRYIGSYYKFNSVLDSAYHYYVNAEKIFYKKNDLENYNIVLLNKGIVLGKINDLFSAEINLNKAFSYYKKSEDYINLYGVLIQLGTVSLDSKNYKQAILYFEDALKIVKDEEIDEQSVDISTCYNNLAASFIGLKQYNKAIEYINIILKDGSVKKNDILTYSYFIDNLAYSKMKMGNLSGVKEGFIESLNIRIKENDISGIILSYNRLSEFYSTIGDEINAVKYSNLALQTAKKSKNPFNVKTALEQASKVDKSNASKHSQEYIRISDSLQIVERKNADRFARIELETDELRQENFELEAQNREIVNYLLGFILLSGSFLYFRLQRARSRELNFKQAQIEANEEIYNLMIANQEQIDAGRDLEKRRISRELHDGVLGRLFGLRLNLEGLNQFNDDDAVNSRQEYLDELKVIEQDLRDISHELNRENSVIINNFETILNNLFETQEKNHPNSKLILDIDNTIDWESLDNTAKLNMYRILQECLQNINKYAKAKKITISFKLDVKNNLHFFIEDDGVGFDSKLRKNKGIGIENIIERVQNCNGEIDIISEIGKGSKIIIIFPLEIKDVIKHN